MPAYPDTRHASPQRNGVGARLVWRQALVAALLLTGGGASTAATFIVSSSADPGDGVCTQAACTLHEAITAANLTPAADTINFAILTPIRGEILIRPTLPLPTILHPVVIDGYAQGGADENTDPTVSNALLRIRIDRSNAGAGDNGLSVCSSNVTIQGLSITGFIGGGLAFGRDQTNASCGTSFSGWVVSGNFLGLRSDGTTEFGNGRGVVVRNGVVRIGGPALADRNVISGNNSHGIELGNAATSASVIENNLIGTDKSGTLARGNGGAGISIEGGAVANVRIGSAVAPNLIAHNLTGASLGTGVASGNTLFGNRYLSNFNLGIDLGDNGVTPNDDNDGDLGPNTLRNFPLIAAASRVTGGLSIQGSEDIGGSAPSTFTFAFYASADCDANGHGEGERLLGTAPRTLQNGVTETFSITLTTSDPLPPGTVITATATDPTGNTSEFSECFFLDPPPLVVNSTADPGTGGCNPTECTLREAIAAVNARAVDSFSTIEFDIPGPGPHVIAPGTDLPTIARPVAIDGYTEPEAKPNTLEVGSNAVLQIELSKSLSVCSPNVTLRGLAIKPQSFSAHGINNVLPCAGVQNLVVVGNYLGLHADGSSGSASIGSGIALGGTDMSGSRIGGSNPGDRNVIGGWNNSGIRIVAAVTDGVLIAGNYVGTAPDRIQPRPNQTEGIFIANLPLGTASPNIVVGGASPAEQNLIANSGGPGISLKDGDTRRIRAFGNNFVGNGGLAIDLGNDGVTTNEPDDTDPGPNGLQNFPELLSAQRSAAGIKIAGTLDLPAGPSPRSYTIAGYASTDCDGSGFGEGERFLGAQTVSLSHVGGEDFSFDLATNDSLPPLTQITTTATDSDGNTSEFSACLTVTDPPPGFVVNTTTDTDDGSCNAAQCSLREAILAANSAVGADQISFSIPGEGPFTISPATNLPTITEAVTIDGYTQLGAAPNTALVGSNAVLLVILEGLGSNNRVGVCANDVTIRGLSIVGFGALESIAFGRQANGSFCTQSLAGARFVGNFLGLLPDGTTTVATSNIELNAAQTEVGGTTLADRNVFAGNGDNILVSAAASTGTTILGNYFGTDASGSGDRGATKDDILIAGVTGVTIGDPVAPNVFRFSRNAVTVSQDVNGARLYANHYADHDGIAIDLCTATAGCFFDVPTGNDPNDGDLGGNNAQNFPELDSAIADVDSLAVQGLLDVPDATANAPYTIALYENVACDISGNGEGEIFLGAQLVNLSGNAQNFSVSLDFPDPAIPPPAAGRFITSTATDPQGNTSELSTCTVVTLPPEIFADGFEG